MNEYKWYTNEALPDTAHRDYDLLYTKPPKRHKPSAALRTVLISAATTLILFLILTLIVLPRIKPSTIISYSSTPSGTRADTSAEQPGISQSSFAAAASKIMPSVVNISVKGISSFFGQTISLGDGNGVIVSDNGYILTSAYFLESGGTITVTASDGTEYDATIISTDQGSGCAILKIEAEGLLGAVLGNSDSINIGDPVIAVGNKISSELSNPVSKGIVSGIDKNIVLRDGSAVNLIQTDATTVTGNIGALLLNSAGEIIGMNTGIISTQSSSAIGVVTPINDIKTVIEGAIGSQAGTAGSASNGLSIGISCSNEKYGIVIEAISENSPAERAGLKVGDLITKANGKAVSTVADINAIKNTLSEGDTITLTLYRDGELIDAAVVLK